MNEPELRTKETVSREILCNRWSLILTLMTLVRIVLFSLVQKKLIQTKFISEYNTSFRDLRIKNV